MVDGKDGLVPLDEEIAKKLRKTNKPVKLVINKIDNDKDSNMSAEFDQLGFKDKVVISAAHNLGLGTLKKSLLDLSPKSESTLEEENGSDQSLLADTKTHQTLPTKSSE